MKLIDVDLCFGDDLTLSPGSQWTIERIGDEPLRVREFFFKFPNGSDLALLDLRIKRIRIGHDEVFYCDDGMNAAALLSAVFNFRPTWSVGVMLTVEIGYVGKVPIKVRLFARGERL